MREIAEFRIPEGNAARFLSKQDGKIIGTSSVRKVLAEVGSPLYNRIGELQIKFYKKKKDFFFLGWHIYREYTKQELSDATLLHLMITSTFEPAGEECGTVYDESSVCPYCKVGRKQTTYLFLDYRKIPKNKDIARTIADEWVISQRLAQLFMEHEITGCELRPVRHKAYYKEDAIDPRQLETGRTLIKLAEGQGIHYPDWEFMVWINKSEQAALVQKMDQEYASKQTAKERRTAKKYPQWYQLVVTSKPIIVSGQTRFGIDPFDEDAKGENRCPNNHLGGLNRLSEIIVEEGSWDGSDIVPTDKFVGTRRGLLTPAPRLLVSQRLYRLFQSENVKGCKFEVAYSIL
jgi:hypothetical protein